MIVYSSLRLMFFFFFKQKTAYEMRISDWSSDVCSSNLFGQRQVGHDALAALRVDDDLVGPLQDLLHGLEVHALGRHFLGLAILLVNLREAARLALGVGDRLLLVGLGLLHDVLRFAAGTRNDVVAIGFRLVLGALAVGLGGLHVAEGIDHRSWRLGTRSEAHTSELPVTNAHLVC